MRKNVYRTALVAVLLTVIAVPGPLAQGLYRKPTRGIFGLKAGVLSGGNFKADRTYHTKLAVAGQVFADFPLTKKLGLVVAFDFYNIRLVTDQEAMIEVSLALKPVIEIVRAHMTIRPGAGIGFAHLSELNVFKATDYPCIKAFLEAYFPINKKKSWIVEMAVVYLPDGGNSSCDISIGPLYMLRGGLAFR